MLNKLGLFWCAEITWEALSNKKNNIEPSLCCIYISLCYKCSRNICKIAENLKCPEPKCLSSKSRDTLKQLNLSIRLWRSRMEAVLTSL